MKTRFVHSTGLAIGLALIALTIAALPVQAAKIPNLASRHKNTPQQPAHPKQENLRLNLSGTVTSVSNTSLSLQTTIRSKKTKSVGLVTVQINSQTKFTKLGQPATLADIKLGNHVRIVRRPDLNSPSIMAMQVTVVEPTIRTKHPKKK